MFKLAVKESNILYQAEAKINKAFQSYNCEDLMNIISKSSICHSSAIVGHRIVSHNGPLSC